MPKAPHYWFPAKRYGWGWGFPCTWQGWVVLAVYVASIAVAAAVVSPSLAPGRFAGCVVGLTGLLIVACWATGEPPRWRWGDRDDAAGR